MATLDTPADPVEHNAYLDALMGRVPYLGDIDSENDVLRYLTKFKEVRDHVGKFPLPYYKRIETALSNRDAATVL